MNIGKKFDRLKQYGKERMGGEVRTDTNDEFKALEMEMQLRQAGMERMNAASGAYVKSMSKRDQGDGKEKQIAVAHFGSTMVSHGDDFEPESEFGQCLLALGRANERIARMQETYVANATSSWLESTERSMVQMKEYQNARKKLDSRRLAYDTASTKMQRIKKEDFKMEEELRNQKAKYEESSEDVYRRMLDIKEAEADSIADLSSFLEAELTYYDRCREVLIQLKRDWPATMAPARSHNASPVNGMARRQTRPRADTGSSMGDRFSRIMEDEPLEPPVRINSRVPSGANSPRRELPGFDLPVRPINSRTNSGFEGPTSIGREASPARLTRIPTEPTAILAGRSNLRTTSTSRAQETGGVFDDDQSIASDAASDFSYNRAGTWSTQAQDSGSTTGRKAPPPPPPSRAKKPPPPPPLKRSALSESQVSRYA